MNESKHFKHAKLKEIIESVKPSPPGINFKLGYKTVFGAFHYTEILGRVA